MPDSKQTFNQKEIEENYPFLTCINYGDKDYLGIVTNRDKTFLSMFDMDLISAPDKTKKFVELGENWWWESNRQIPIDVFLFQELIPFRYAIRTFENKHIEVKFGPVTEINNLVKKRIKRRTITLVKNVPSKDSQ